MAVGHVEMWLELRKRVGWGQRGGNGGSGDANWQSMGAIATGARALFNRMPVAMVVRSDCQEPVEP